MQILIESDESRLCEYKFTFQPLVKKCIKDVKSLLHNKPPIIIFGKVCNQQRDVGFFSNESAGYNYSKQMMPAQPLTYNLDRLIIRVNELLNTTFNAILINRYNDANDYISAHSDDERYLSSDSIVAAISYGGERTFRIRNKNTKEIILDVLTNNRKILVMDGNFQKIYTHEIPKERFAEPRYSFTFRQHDK